MAAVTEVRTTVVPSEEVLPQVLPTERLTASGMPAPPLRTDLRRIDDLRNVGSIVLTWAHALVTIGLAVWIDHPLAYAVAFVFMGPAFARFAIIAHEAAHKLLFTNKRWNDAVGRWLLAYPAFVPLEAYRRGHFAHHKDEFGPNEPDMNLYQGYPITEADLEAAVDQAGVRPEAGDIVLVRTGKMALFKGRDREGCTIGWMHRHDVAAVATDTFTLEVWPGEDPSVLFPVHMIQLRDMGLTQGQNFDLEELAAHCAADGRYEMLLVANPEPVTGGAGAPTSPVAVK